MHDHATLLHATEHWLELPLCLVGAKSCCKAISVCVCLRESKQALGAEPIQVADSRLDSKNANAFATPADDKVIKADGCAC